MARKQTTELLKQLRSFMQDTSKVGEPLAAYIVPTADEHNSEYVAESDKRRAFLSGFKGSAGTALVTRERALMWTDGRYYLQSSQEMDANWTLMKDGLPDTPSLGNATMFEFDDTRLNFPPSPYGCAFVFKDKP